MSLVTWPVSSGATPNPPTVTPTNDVFGTDLFFNGNLSVTAKGDYKEVSGDENLRRALIRRLITEPGDYKRNPAFGVGILSYIKKPMTASRLDRLQHRIRDNLSFERRLDKVLAITLTPTIINGSNVLDVNVQAQAKGRNVRLQQRFFAPQP